MKPKSFSNLNNVKPPQKYSDTSKKDNGKPVRVSTEYYERLRAEAFKRNIPIKTLLDDIIDSYYSEL